MIILKEVKHYPDSNSVEATWVDENDVAVKCHSYSDVQMDMLRADLGADASTYADLMVTVEANIKPPAPRPGQRAAEIKAELSAIDLKSIRALREGDTARITALEAQAQVLRDELRLLQ